MAIKTIPAAELRHLYQGKPGPPLETVLQRHGVETDGPQMIPAAARTPLAKPEPLESIFARLWAEHGNGLAPVREYTFHEVRRWRFDFCFPDYLVAVECDGITAKGKGGRHNSDGDRDKINCAAATGWRILRFSRMQLEDQPERCAQLVREALEFSGAL